MKKPRQRGEKLGGEGGNPITTNFPAVIPINIIRRPLNFNGFSKLTVMKMRDLCNDLSLLNTYMMLGLRYMFHQSRRFGPPMLDINSVFLNPLVNRLTCFTHV